jgi:hypothetical protein
VSTESIDLFKLADDVFDRLAISGYEALGSLNKVFVCVWSLKGEVDNGGFDQWLFNSSGDWAYDTPRCLEEIGAVKTAAIVKEAINIFPGGVVPVDLEERRTAMENIGETVSLRWDKLSDIFYREEENLDELLAAYILSNKDTNAL